MSWTVTLDGDTRGRGGRRGRGGGQASGGVGEERRGGGRLEASGVFGGLAGEPPVPWGLYIGEAPLASFFVMGGGGDGSDGSYGSYGSDGT